jgi:hypothetical protein
MKMKKLIWIGIFLITGCIFSSDEKEEEKDKSGLEPCTIKIDGDADGVIE